MSSGNERVYKDGRAVWEAATTRAKATAKATGQDAGALLSRFVFGRFLARVFSTPTSPWVLKGGSAVLVRVHDARSTTDIDLFHQLNDLDVAIAALRTATGLDLGDHFRFVVTKVDTEVGGTAQPNVAGAQLHLDAYIGTRKINGFHVDLATGSLMTAEPQTRPAISIDLPGITPATVRLYPVVDHIADKVCAIQALYGQDQRPSSRHRDLVDLVVFALTEDIDGTELTTFRVGGGVRRRATLICLEGAVLAAKLGY